MRQRRDQRQPQAVLDIRRLDAVLFDLDGVITRTARVHAAAWKQLFDAYLRQRADTTGEPYLPFDLDTDYRRYVDGKPRYDGVRSFLESRDIRLPEGSADDPAGHDTIYGLGNAKQAHFLTQLKSEGVEVYDTTVACLHALKAHGLKLGVISSSKNCAVVLDAAGISDLFDVRVDGVESERLHLPGKPAPDVFLEAAKRLGVEPARVAIVEDATVGVQAGRRGDFACVIGIDRDDHATALKNSGADLVVRDLAEVVIAHQTSEGATSAMATNPTDLPAALEHLDDVIEAARHKQLVVFLDYDGTLTPIVERPEDAVLSERMRAALTELAHTMSVAIVSGRDLADVRRLVQLDQLYYAGSHGFEMAGPQGVHAVYDPAQAFLPDLDHAEEVLRTRLTSLQGAQIERKRFAIAIHYRRVRQDDVATVATAVEAVQRAHPRLRQTGGKRLLELRPDLPWHKGTALLWLLEVMELSRDDVLPVYIGDDLTDEDAFTTLQEDGIGILVMDGAHHATAARYALADTAEVHTWLTTLAAAQRRKSLS